VTETTVADMVEDREDADGEMSAGAEPKSSKLWLRLIADAERVFDRYQQVADNIDQLYGDLDKLATAGRDRQFQLFWANVQVLGPSIYARPPVPVVVPQFKDRKPVPRLAAELLERSTIVAYRGEDIDGVMRLVRDDLNIQSRGAAWIRYEAERRDGRLVERVCIDHADRRDFLHDPARNWKEVDWVAKRSWLTKSGMRKRFRKTSGLAYRDASYSVRVDDADADDGKLKAGVWELWCKSANTVVWITEGCKVVLDQSEPHLQLEDFFPCPKPAYGTVRRRTLIPVPDVLYYKDQLEEINELTGRIAALADALKVRGFYPAGGGDLGDAIEAAIKETRDNQILIGVSNWALLGNGTPKDMIVWLPLDMVASTIKELVALRKELFDDVYQIIGLSDIMRGLSEASETLGAQQLKSQYGSVRIRDKKDEIVRMARDITRIVGEIMAENFQPETLLDMSQLDVPREQEIVAQAAPVEQQIRLILSQVEQAKANPELQQRAQANPQQAEAVLAQAKQQVGALRSQLQKINETATIEKVMALLREQRMRPFVLDIETDSTIAPDEDAAKQRATEFVTAVGGVMKEAAAVMQAMPEAAPVIAETLKFTASQFRAGRQMEGVIDEFADKIADLAGQPKPPDPKQAEAARAQAAEQLKQETQKAENAEKMANAQKVLLEAQAKAAADEIARKIREQEALDAAETRRVEREGKVQLANKQIELLDAKRAEENERHLQDMARGDLELEKLNREIEHVGIKSDATAAAASAQLAAEVPDSDDASPTEAAPAPPARSARQPYRRPDIVMAEMLKNVTDQFAQQNGAVLAAISEQNAALTRALTAPKVIVTDAGGNPIGVKTAEVN
jgi:hypothetical protein